jgi:Fic family protein
MTAIKPLPEISFRIETDRFGPFQFDIGIDPSEIFLLMQRIEDAHGRFSDSPLAQVANKLEREVIASSIFGTNTIEGGALTEEETASAMDLDPAVVQEIEQRRVLNIKAAYDHARKAAQTDGWRLSVDFVQKIHSLITDGIPHQDNQPGMIRDNPKERTTYVGDEAHGGRYKPPQLGRDVFRLLQALIEWHQKLVEADVHPLIRAPLVHYYYELIHPFWDGNGRVGRVLEATILLSAGYRYAPFAMARYYLENIDRYFAQFNFCRKASKRHEAYPNTSFVVFHQEGMLQTINSLHDRVNQTVKILLFETYVRDLLDKKQINSRQYTVLSQLRSGPVALDQVRHAPWYVSLYLRLNDKTRSRDLHRLREMELVYLDMDNRLSPGFIKPKNVKPL